LRKEGSGVMGMRVPNLITGPFSPPVSSLWMVKTVMKKITKGRRERRWGAI